MTRLKTLIWTAALCACNAAYATQISSEVDPSLAGGSLIDFESATLGNWTTQGFSGLTITAIPSTDVSTPSFSIDADYPGYVAGGGLQHITNHGTEFQTLRLDFNAPAQAFGLLFFGSEATWTLNAYSASNTLLETRVIPSFGNNSGGFFGFAGLTGASYATVTQNFDNSYSGGGIDYVMIDNIHVSSVTTVPEPETYALMLAGLGMLGFFRRRNQRRG